MKVHNRISSSVSNRSSVAMSWCGTVMVLRVNSTQIFAPRGLCRNVFALRRQSHVSHATPRNELQRECEKLEQLVQRYDDAYYNKAASTVSDEVYDATKARLAALQAQLQGIPIPQVQQGHVIPLPPPVSALSKVRHPLRMLSLAAVHSQETLQSWHDGVCKRLADAGLRKAPSWVVEPKVDGLAVRVLYEHGKLVQAATRGDGELGEDVTHNALCLQGLPTQLQVNGEADIPERLEVRGEVYMTKADFQAVKSERAGEVAMSTARNSAAGALRLLDPEESRKRRLSFMAYQLLLPPGPGAEAPPSPHLTSTQWEALQWLRDLGFAVNPDNQLLGTFPEALSAAKLWMESREDLGYEVDGAVLKVNEFSMQESLGVVASDPRWAVAWKFKALTGVTRLRDISLSVGRTGQVVPVAELDELEMQGVKVTRASLHNVGLVKSIDLRLGDTVVVQRCGDVIPQVVRPLVEMRDGSELPWEPPSTCPCPLRAPLEMRNTGGAEVLMCTAEACPRQAVRQVRHYASTCIPFMGGETVEQLVEAGVLAGIADIYNLTEAKLVELPRWGVRKAAKLLGSIEASKQLPIDTILVGLGIKMIGKSAAEELAAAYPSIDALAKDARAGRMRVNNVGNVASESLREWFSDQENQALLSALRGAGIRAITGAPATESTSGPAGPPGRSQAASPETPTVAQTLAGMMVVVTGTLVQHGLTRSQFKALVEAAGGKLQDSLRSDTALLVVGEKAGSKEQEATRRGIPTMAEADFFDKYLNQASAGPPPTTAVAATAPPSPSPPSRATAATPSPRQPSAPQETPPTARRRTIRSPTAATAAVPKAHATTASPPLAPTTTSPAKAPASESHEVTASTPPVATTADPAKAPAPSKGHVAAPQATEPPTAPVSRAAAELPSEPAAAAAAVASPGPSPGSLAGMEIVVTGVLTQHGITREKFRGLIEAAGAKLVDRVRGGISFLVTGDKPGANKLEAARRQGTPIITEQLFFERYLGEVDIPSRQSSASTYGDPAVQAAGAAISRKRTAKSASAIDGASTVDAAASPSNAPRRRTSRRTREQSF